MQKEKKKKIYRPPATGFQWAGAKLERKFNQAAIKSPFMHKILAFFFMPLAYKVGMKVNYSEEDFYVEVPHRRINRNAYGTVGGASLLANLELAAGSYLFMLCDGYRLVCRNVHYSFKLPSTNGLHFKVEPDEEDLDGLIKANKPFNANLKVAVYSCGDTPGTPGRRIGRGTICFHLWPRQGETS